tara:strand:- start:1383 stop:2492 length:1110 start_codon:yes stop_codon:yes gene_type:complete
MTFKPLNENDTVNTRTLLHEAIPLTGAIVSGTYGVDNIKTYSHGMFQSVYDYPYLSSSANHIFDITAGMHVDGTITSGDTQFSKKRNIYNQMAQILMGYDATGSIRKFDEDGDIVGTSNKLEECFIMPFSRLLVKDEIKKETFSIQLDVTDYAATNQPFGANDIITISDLSASTGYKTNSPAGDYGILYATASTTLLNTSSTHKETFDSDDYWYAGLIFYQAGIIVLTGSVFGTQLTSPLDGTSSPNVFYNDGSALGIDDALTGSTIDVIGESLRHRIFNIEFNNTTELNSTVYFCRINHNEFNYSSNPTYVSGSRIQVKTQASDEPLAYITTIGLYNDNNELLATAKLSEPLKKSASNEFTIRARLDY